MKSIYIKWDSIKEILDIKNILDSAGYEWEKRIIMTDDLREDIKSHTGTTNFEKINYEIKTLLWMPVALWFVELSYSKYDAMLWKKEINLDESFEQTGWSARTKNILRREGMYKIEDVEKKTIGSLYMCKWLWRRCVDEIRDYFKSSWKELAIK